MACRAPWQGSSEAAGVKELSIRQPLLSDATSRVVLSHPGETVRYPDWERPFSLQNPH